MYTQTVLCAFMRKSWFSEEDEKSQLYEAPSIPDIMLYFSHLNNHTGMGP